MTWPPTSGSPWTCWCGSSARSTGPACAGGRRDTYLHLYEHFLELYDNELRKKSGSYYTPREVVEQMVRLTEDALVTRLGKQPGSVTRTS